MEFLIPKGSNSGIKFHAVYEIQIYDSYGKKEGPDRRRLRRDLPAAELLPAYKHLDKGIAPKVNACKAPGKWQTLTAIFLSPRFDGRQEDRQREDRQGDAQRRVIHENKELKTPTGHNHTKKEIGDGAAVLQGDHGPVAFRNVRVRPYKEGPK